MCTLAAASLALTAVGTMQQASAQNDAGKAAQGQLNYQAAIDRNNALVKGYQATDAINRGKEEERQRRQQTNQMKSSQRVAFASLGIDLGSENVAETLADTAMIGELDALTIRTNAQREAWGYNVEGDNLRAQAAGRVIAGKNARAAGRDQAFGTILGGASTVSKQWSSFNAAGGTVLG